MLKYGDYQRDGSHSDGLKSRCKPCCTAAQRSRRAKLREARAAADTALLLGDGAFASPEDAVKFIHDIAPIMVPEEAVEVVWAVIPDWLKHTLAFYDLHDIGSQIRRHVDIPA
jgi:hypothetical protein